MEFHRQRITQEPLTKQPKLPVVLLSIVFHLALGMLVLTLDKEPEISGKIKDNTYIQATLLSIDGMSEPAFDAPANGDAVKEASISTVLSIDETKRIMVDQTGEQKASGEQVLTNQQDAIETNIHSFQQSPADVRDDRIYRARELAQQHLHRLVEQANRQVAQDESKRYQESQNSPDLRIPTNTSFLTEDEKFIQQKTVHINCSSGLNKAITNISRTLGGQVTCTELPEINGYIEDRLNKTALVNKIDP